MWDPTSRVEPLSKFPVLDTNCLDTAEHELTRHLTDARIRKVSNRDRFRLEMNRVDIGRCSLVFNRYGSETVLDTDVEADSILLIVGGSTPTRITSGRESVTVSHRRAAIYTPAEKMRIERREGSEILVLRSTMRYLRHHLGELKRRLPRGPLGFDRSIDLTTGPGATLHRMLSFLLSELAQSDHLLGSPALRESCDQMLLTALLDLPHRAVHRFEDAPRHRASPALVRRAEEYMRAHSREPVAILDLVRVCECRRSALFAAFRDVRGYSPMEFLTEARLQDARARLRDPHPEATVGTVALACGFLHPGRFSRSYRERFGEPPSRTLRDSL